MTCANRVFIVELQWNPSVESQAIARAIRLGQDQDVSVIRYIINDTVEQVNICLVLRDCDRRYTDTYNQDMQAQQQRKLMMAQKGFEEGDGC